MADHTNSEWPIAAAMLQFAAVARDGQPVTEASPELWRQHLQQVVDAGFTDVEVSTSWLRLGDLSTERLEDFRKVLDHAGLSVPGISVVRQSVIHPVRGEANLGFAHRTIDAAAQLGVGVVCLGLHDELLPAQKQATWFWTVPGPQRPEDPEVRALAVRRYRELAAHASSVEVQLSLELYEDTYLGTADEAVRFIEDVGHASVGLNPDVGNLIRQQRPVEHWEYIVDRTLAYANYWHVKNYARLEDPAKGLVLTHPTSLELGIVNYRRAIQSALALGFSGPFVVEHYGGDGLSVGATNARYLRTLLPAQPNLS
ncbi:MAG TPA: sugar phosphate isomerase/epimerase family protein [Paenarthrobacter sp.]|nr:sugar phosphate isomerase/epimerase family protein [Paenarthrobacter sp.]